MHAIAVPSRSRSLRLSRRPPRPSFRAGLAGLIVVVVGLAILATMSTFAYLRLPVPTGHLAVGRTTVLLSDPHRLEPRTAAGERRQVGLVVWYPAEAGTGKQAEYVPGFEALREGLEASGELSPLALAGLGLVGTASWDGAAVLASDGAHGTAAFPVVLLSPGNATNVAFYGSLAEDLASNGYVVIGVDHAYQVAAVDIGHGRVAVYEGDDPVGGTEDGLARRIDERVADLTFVIDRLEAHDLGIEMLDGRLDLGRVAVVGHSNGGTAAAQLCALDARVDACANIDGQAAGGPFGARVGSGPPTKPFLFLTKETQLHPALAEHFEAGGTGTYRVVVPAATHQSFGDGPRFEPRIAPVDGSAEHVLTIERGFVGAFLDHVLRGAPETVFGEVAAPTDVYVEVYPLGSKPQLPS